MSQRQLDKLTDLCHLLPASTDIIVSDLVEVTLLVFPLNGLALAVDDGILGNDAVFRRINLDNLKLDLSHATTAGEEVALSDGPIRLSEVWCKEHVEERASQAFNSVGDGQNSDTLGLGICQFRLKCSGCGTYVFDVRASMDGDDITMFDTEIVSDDTVHAGTAIVKIVIS